MTYEVFLLHLFTLYEINYICCWIDTDYKLRGKNNKQL